MTPREVKKFFSNITEAKFAYKSRRIELKERIKVRLDETHPKNFRKALVLDRNLDWPGFLQ